MRRAHIGAARRVTQPYRCAVTGTTPVDVAAVRGGRWHHGVVHPSRLVLDLFGEIDPDEVPGVVSSWCLRVLGSPIRQVLFWVEGVGCAVGVELRDGRGVLVKVVRPDQPSARLGAVQDVQRGLLADGFPAPTPIHGPAALANGLAFAEELHDVGVVPNGHLPGHRREMAAGLARLIDVCDAADAATRASLALGRPGWADYSSGGLWPVPHRPDVDLTATGEGSDMLDELARVSKRVLRTAEEGRSVIGHSDWEAQNLRFENERLAMVYDWDSLVVAPESVIVGFASAVFCGRSEPGLGDVPTEAEQGGFLAEYQDAAGHEFTPAEQSIALAAASWVTAYNARFQYSAWRRPPHEGGRSHLDNAPVMLDRLRRRSLAEESGDTARQPRERLVGA